MKTYFTDEELQCKHCGLLIFDPEFRQKLDHARESANIPFIVTSGYRCPEHNKSVGSTSTNHTSGKAADIYCKDSHARYEIVKALIQCGMMGIGVGGRFIHCDTNRTRREIFTY